MILACDNLNTHTISAFYEALTTDAARELVKRLKFRHSPNHGSWLNIAENELRALPRHRVWVYRRFETIENLRAVAAWSAWVKAKLRGGDRKLRSDDTEIKLISLKRDEAD